MIFFCRTEQRRQKAASTDPLILFSSQYKLWWTRGASNGGIKNVFKKNTGIPPMCGTRRPALGPLCFAVEREREVTEMEIWRINSYSIYAGKKEDLRNYTKHIVRKEGPYLDWKLSLGSRKDDCQREKKSTAVWRQEDEVSIDISIWNSNSVITLKQNWVCPLHNVWKREGKMPAQRTNLVFSPKLHYSKFNCHFIRLVLNWFSEDVIHTYIF